MILIGINSVITFYIYFVANTVSYLSKTNMKNMVKSYYIGIYLNFVNP